MYIYTRVCQYNYCALLIKWNLPIVVSMGRDFVVVVERWLFDRDVKVSAI